MTCALREAAGATPARAQVPQVVVRVLGPVEVLGAARPFRRPWTLELVSYLALHPRGATAEAWTTALWPERLRADATRHSTVSEARRALGPAADGGAHVVRRDGRLQLGPWVTTDWAQFRSLAAVDGPAAEDAWSAALELVRGRPLDGLRSFDWALLEGLVAEIEASVVELALGLAERHLASGDGRAAERAARKALLACPYDERLYRTLFVAADSQGNPAGVESAMSDLVRLLSGDADADAAPARSRRTADPTAWVHPDTVSLYRSLVRRPGAAPSPRAVTTATR